MLAWIPLFPLIGFLINGLWYALGQTRPGAKKAGSTVTGIIASAALFASFVLSVILFAELSSLPGEHRVLEQILFSWIQFGEFSLDFGLRIDVLSVLFCLVITGVGFLIHVYSIGYMSHDESPGKFFAYLNLFCFAMLVLVLGSSMPVMFLGWEGVGLCSYLLIGFWYEDVEKASAGKKAFIVNRVGDLGFLLGMFLIFWKFGTLDFQALSMAVASNVAALDLGLVTLICILLFVGCTGKSAQIPLYVWLPDAMAGPTPVSALIHAATMVTSGIYLVSRLNFLYALSPIALAVVAWIGALTALFAATMALAQTDIKKVLAYSTVSQLGYMFLGCGVGAFGAGVFHVITHAFFKALLFLGAGSVIYGMHHEQDILKMGGLRAKMPQTFLVFAAGWLAICGVPGLSGFFSKDEILWEAFSSPHGSHALWMIGALTAFMTAFYMTRLFSLTFLGKSRTRASSNGHGNGHGHAAHGNGHGIGKSHAVHESPPVMVYPLFVLAVLSVAGGWIGIPHLSWLEHWLEPVLGGHAAERTAAPAMEWLLMAVSVAVALAGMGAGLSLYRNLSAVEALKNRWAMVHRFLFNKWYVDELYETVFVRPVHALSVFLWRSFDVAVIDRVVLSFGRVSMWTGQTMRVIQTGSLQVYAVLLVTGLIVTLGYFIYAVV